MDTGFRAAVHATLQVLPTFLSKKNGCATQIQRLDACYFEELSSEHVLFTFQSTLLNVECRVEVENYVALDQYFDFGANELHVPDTEAGTNFGIHRWVGSGVTPEKIRTFGEAFPAVLKHSGK
ncbi:hypothetical protein C8R45DRAFT_926843 [Mycena sanguinolenta]|nr:hypothetical protein C8R45DRAFT_926843 [Mycena sanguinolenta]